MRSELDRKLAAMDARRNAGHRRARVIAVVVTVPLVFVLTAAADRAGFYTWTRFWALIALIIGGLVYALVSYFLVPEGED